MDWRLPDEALREVLRSNWGLRDGRITPLIGGATSDVWLVEAGGHWYVAKFAYDDTSRFELGLLAAEAVQREGLRCAAPVHTLSGALSVELEGPPGRRHPLALLEFVPGTPSHDRADAPEVAGATLARVHTALLVARPEIPVERRKLAYIDYLRDHSVEVAQEAWVRPVMDAAVAAAEEIERLVDSTYGIGVFDGPQILVDDRGHVGLIDFGVVQWQPLVFGVANYILSYDRGTSEGARLISTYRDLSDLPELEFDAVDTYRAVCLAIYAKYAAWKLAHRNTRGETLERTAARLAELRASLQDLLPA